MKQRWVWAVVAAVAVGMVCSPVSALAGGKKAGGKAGKAEYKPVVWLVDSVGANNVSLTKSDHSELTNLNVAATTQIVVKGQPGKLADIKAGMRAEFVATGANVTLLTVDEYIAPAEPAAKAGKAGKAGGKAGGKRK